MIVHLQKRLFVQRFLCLSRACLGKVRFQHKMDRKKNVSAPRQRGTPARSRPGRGMACTPRRGSARAVGRPPSSSCRSTTSPSAAAPPPPPPPLPPVPRPGLQCLLRLALALLQREQQQSVRALRKRQFRFEFSLRLSRACLGKTIVFSIKRRENGVSFTCDDGLQGERRLLVLRADRESRTERLGAYGRKHTQGLFSLQLSFVVVRSLSWQMIVSQQKTTRQ